VLKLNRSTRYQNISVCLQIVLIGLRVVEGIPFLSPVFSHAIPSQMLKACRCLKAPQPSQFSLFHSASLVSTVLSPSRSLSALFTLWAGNAFDTPILHLPQMSACAKTGAGLVGMHQEAETSQKQLSERSAAHFELCISSHVTLYIIVITLSSSSLYIVVI
jgi:hypothetical protein